nr:hypothetical protein [Angustibacter aerolatus]
MGDDGEAARAHEAARAAERAAEPGVRAERAEHDRAAERRPAEHLGGDAGGAVRLVVRRAGRGRAGRERPHVGVRAPGGRRGAGACRR